MSNLLSDVRISCDYVVQNLKYTSIDNDAIVEKAVPYIVEHCRDIKNGQIDWDSCNWHYNMDAYKSGPLTAQYIFVLDALNFCFWPKDNFDYETLAIALKKVLENNISAFTAANLSKLNQDEFQSWFSLDNMIPNIPERLLRLQEIGRVLEEDFHGLASNIVLAANHSAVKLVELTTRYFVGFRDTAIYEGRLIHFYKRAQILVGDLWAAYGRSLDPQHPYYFYDIDQLTMFADYRVPQILRDWGVIQYNSELANNVDQKELIEFGSPKEVEIRAITIVAVERIRSILLEMHKINLLVLEVDWLLWQVGEKQKNELLPHHRTLTIYY